MINKYICLFNIYIYIIYLFYNGWHINNRVNFWQYSQNVFCRIGKLYFCKCRYNIWDLIKNVSSLTYYDWKIKQNVESFLIKNIDLFLLTILANLDYTLSLNWIKYQSLVFSLNILY